MEDRFDFKKGLEKKSKFLNETKKKYDKKGEEIESLKQIKVDGLLNDMNSFPGRIHIAGPIGETSVEGDKENYNSLHDKNGKYMAGNDKGKEANENDKQEKEV